MAFDWPPSVGADGCVGGPRPGTSALEGALRLLWGPSGVGSWGIYNCRRIDQGESWSVHAEGRALDLSVPLPPSEVGRGILGAIGESATELGVQRVIYARTVYDAATPGGRPYTGDSDHFDHLHIEQTPGGAEWLTQSRAVALLDHVAEETEEGPMLIVAYRGAQWIVRGDLSGKVGIAQGDDVRALLSVGGGRVYFPATLTEGLMAKIPTLA